MVNTSFDLTGKTALITGGAGLLGSQHADALLENGAKVILTDISIERLELARENLSLKYQKDDIHINLMDVSKLDSVQKTNNKIKEEGLKVNILINNAAIDPKVNKENEIIESSRLENFSLENWNHQISVGLTGAFLCSQVFGNEMAKRKEGGCIINISSDLSIIAPYQKLYESKSKLDSEQHVKPVTYSVIKTGLIGLTKYIATYWNKSGIRCNALSPGGIYTNQPEEFVKRLSELIPLGRMANKEEYKSAIQFLCSDASSYMNGHNLVIDGGRSIW